MNFELLPYSDEFRDDLLALWARALPLDAITAETLESRVLLDENFDPETFLLCRNDERKLIGFVLGVYPERLPLGDADPAGDRGWITALGLDPSTELNRVGGALLAGIENRLRKLGKSECLVSGYPPGYFTPGIDRQNYPALFDLFRSHGYEAVREALSMDASIVLFTVPDAVVAREHELNEQGVEIRPYRRTDLLRFLTFLEGAMPSDWVRVERNNLRKLAEGAFHPEQIFLAVREGSVIGYCQFEGAHFGPFGVNIAFQGQGIGTVLLARTLERMRMEGHHNAWVMWTDDVAAKVYGKFGFSPTRRFTLLKKRL
jgi:mycothiol synthase